MGLELGVGVLVGVGVGVELGLGIGDALAAGAGDALGKASAKAFGGCFFVRLLSVDIPNARDPGTELPSESRLPADDVVCTFSFSRARLV